MILSDAIKDLIAILDELCGKWSKVNLKPYQIYKGWTIDKEGVFIHYTYAEQLNNIDYSMEDSFEFVKFDNL